MTDNVDGPADDFGDDDAEDAWDDDDPVEAKMAILERVVAQLRTVWDDRGEARRVDALRLLSKLEQEHGVDMRLRAIRDDLEELGDG